MKANFIETKGNKYIPFEGGLFPVLAKAPLWPLLTFFKIDFPPYKQLL